MMTMVQIVLCAVYAVTAIAVLIAIISDPQAFAPDPAGRMTGTRWYFFCAALALLIAVFWPITVGISEWLSWRDGECES